MTRFESYSSGADFSDIERKPTYTEKLVNNRKSKRFGNAVIATVLVVTGYLGIEKLTEDKTDEILALPTTTHIVKDGETTWEIAAEIENQNDPIKVDAEGKFVQDIDGELVRESDGEDIRDVVRAIEALNPDMDVGEIDRGDVLIVPTYKELDANS